MVENRENLDEHEIKAEANAEQTNVPVDADKSNGLAQLAIGGLVGAVMGTVAVVLADKKTANILNQTAKDLGNAVKGATEGVNKTIKSKVETVKNKASSFNNSIKDSKKTVENETEVQLPVENSETQVETIEDAKSSDSQAKETSNDVGVFQLYEERLIANKKQVKTGEVAIAKHVETHIAQVSIPLEKERLVVEQIPVDDRNPVASSEANFNGGELARIEIYEQTAEIEKKAFVREQVRVRKEVEHKALAVEDKIRREELDVEIQNSNDNHNLPVRTTDKDTHSDRQDTRIEQTNLTFNQPEGKL